jgi:hypothetical protein
VEAKSAFTSDEKLRARITRRRQSARSIPLRSLRVSRLALTETWFLELFSNAALSLFAKPPKGSAGASKAPPWRHAPACGA